MDNEEGDSSGDELVEVDALEESDDDFAYEEIDIDEDDPLLLAEEDDFDSALSAKLRPVCNDAEDMRAAGLDGEHLCWSMLNATSDGGHGASALGGQMQNVEHVLRTGGTGREVPCALADAHLGAPEGPLD